MSTLTKVQPIEAATRPMMVTISALVGIETPVQSTNTVYYDRDRDPSTVILRPFSMGLAPRYRRGRSSFPASLPSALSAPSEKLVRPDHQGRCRPARPPAAQTNADRLRRRAATPRCFRSRA